MNRKTVWLVVLMAALAAYAHGQFDEVAQDMRSVLPTPLPPPPLQAPALPRTPAAPMGQDTYRVQVGAFRDHANAQAYIGRLQSADFHPVWERVYDRQHGAITRVFISGVRVYERPMLVQRLSDAGFRPWAHGEDAVFQVPGGMEELAVVARPLPARRVGARALVPVSASGSYTVAISADGSLWAWGRKVCEEGRIIQNYGNTPVEIGTATNWASVSAGESHTVALRTDGSLWAWGNNSSGQLGDGTRNQRVSPVRIGADTNWEKVSAGSHTTSAIRTDGSLWAWGRKPISAQHGGGDQQFILDYGNSPIRIGTYTNWESVSTGKWHTIAVRTDGSIWAWGCNLYGQLGIGGAGFGFADPVQIGTDRNWEHVDISRNTVAVRTDGSLRAWGGWDGGPPTRRGMDTNWVFATTGLGHTVAIRADGSLWAWGQNRYGQLGDGTTIDRYTPVQIWIGVNWVSVPRDGKTENGIYKAGENFEAPRELLSMR